MSLSKILQEYRNKKREFPTYEELAAIASSEPCADPIVERNVSLLRERSTVGVQKYGTTLADNKLPLRAWLNHALEEALDQANYLQAAMAEIDSAAPQTVSSTEITDTNLVDLCAFMNAASISNIPILLSAQSAGALVKAMTTSAPVQEQEPDDAPVDIPKSISEKDHYVYLRGYYDGERATIAPKATPTPK